MTIKLVCEVCGFEGAYLSYIQFVEEKSGVKKRGRVKKNGLDVLLPLVCPNCQHYALKSLPELYARHDKEAEDE